MNSFALILAGLFAGVAPGLLAGDSPPHRQNTSPREIGKKPRPEVRLQIPASSSKPLNGGSLLVTPGFIQVLPPPNSKSWRPPSPGQELSPGLYKSVPYTCLVLVPRSHLDDKFVIGGGGPGGNIDSMPIIRPSLRLVPLKPVLFPPP